MIGKTINQYKILEKLGSGGMGDVYKADDTKLRRTVALKFLPLEMTRDEKAQDRFVHEARAASALDHPNIGTIHEINEADGTSFIVMAYYSGVTLKDKIEQGPLAVDEALKIAIQLAQGLAAAHAKEIVHRDMKPANVIVTEDEQVKIIDFGLAKLMGRTALTKTGTTMGTVAYMSPEQAQNEGVDHRTDIWSLGVIFYEMLAGKNPFMGDYEQAVIYSILNEDPEFITKVRSEVPVQIERILEKALVKDPEKRYQTMKQMLDELKNAMEELKEVKPRKPSFYKLGRKQRKYAYRAFGVVLLLIAFGFYFWQNQIAEATPVSIALLPLESITNDTEQEWFTDGMTDALITDLAKISGLRVISRSSVMRYKGKDMAISEIAAELGVDFVVEGSVVKMEDQVKVSARLIYAPKDEYLWADDYEREFIDILGLQGQIAKTIASQVQVRLTPKEEATFKDARQVDPNTYEAYLKGMFYLNKFTPEGFEKGLAYLHEAIEKDPMDALAHAGLALGYSLIASHSPTPPPDAFAKARSSARKALELDENLAEAHGALAEIRLYKEWDWAGAEESFLSALQLNPSLAPAHAHYAWYLSLFGKLDEAFSEMKQAKLVDPLNPLWTTWVGDLHWSVGEYDQAILEFEKAFELDPNFPWANLMLGFAYAGKGMYDEAIAAQRTAVAANPGWKGALGYTHALAGRIEDAQEIVSELKEMNDPMNALFLAAIYTAMGEKDEAFHWLEVSYQHRHPFTPFIRNPHFEPLREDARFKDLLVRMKLAE